MLTPDQILLHRIVAKQALKQGRITPEQYSIIIRNLDSMEKRNEQTDKELLSKAKSKILNDRSFFELSYNKETAHA